MALVIEMDFNGKRNYLSI